MISPKKPTSFFKEKLHAVGNFYMKHRRFFAMVKLVLLAGVMTITFSTRTPSGKVVHHGVSTTYAGGFGVCGNAICESNDSSCTVNNTDCGKISTGSCSPVPGCTVKTTDVYSCAGTTFSCAGIGDKTTCGNLGCFWINSCTNDNGAGKTANETCTALSNQTTCGQAGGAVGDCSRTKSGSTEVCAGTITIPTKESDCTTLSGLIISFGLTAIRTPAYTEDSATCPQDCTSAVCGNGIKEIGETCDNGGNNSNTTPGACKTTCNGYIAAACSGTVVPNSGMCKTLSLADPAKECSNYYYTLGQQCIYDSKTSLCLEGSSCTVPVAAVCGNGIKESPEICDEGVNNGTKIGACNVTCNGTVTSICGNGIKESPEICDDGQDNGKPGKCNITCNGTAPVCGNKIKESPEMCDDGQDNGKPGKCNVTCNGTAPVCGNKIKESPEMCDDGQDNGKPGKCNVTCNGTVPVAAICGNGVKESPEMCDDGVDNGTKPGGCNATCDGTVAVAECGNGIIGQGEMCDNGLNNGKPGQCNSTCNGWLAYNGSCGDKTCGSYCAIDANVTCDSLNASESTKNLCSTLGCFLQKTNIYDCAGTVSCEKITKSAMYNDQYMVGKYCNLAGCSYDGKSGLCTTPAKAPSCGNLPAAEYCKMLSPMGCNLTTDGVSTTCVGNTALRSDKLNQSQCTTMNGTWNTEDTSTCSTDCKVTCAANSTSDCGSVSIEQCTNYYGGSANCIVSKGVCTKGDTQCTTCGNNVCDNKETYTTCPSDCNKGDWPSISYTPSIPKDGTLVKGPVIANVTFGNGCTILNNNGSTSYTFNYNGYFIFKVSCPWLGGKTLDIGAKVYRLQNNIKEAANLSDISTSSGSTLYCENKDNLVGEVAANNTNMIEMAKKAIYEQSLTSSSATLKSEFSDKVTISGNISFVNGANTLTKIELTKDLTGSATKATVIIPANSTIISQDLGGKTSDFKGLFLAPTLADTTIVENLSEQIKNEENNNVAVVLKVGDEENTKLMVVDTGDEAQEFIITLELTGYKEGDSVEIFSSQEGNVWTSYGFATVNADGEVSFAVPHLTYYGITSEGGSNEDTTTPTPTGSNGGGGGGSSINQCTADRDCKNSYLITVCGACTEAEKVAEIKVKQNSVVCYNYSSELNGAYSFAYANAITTIADCEKANLNGELLRSHMAKMMSNFAVNTLGLKPNTGTVCEFTDMDNETAEMKFYAKLACQLGLMGLDTDGKANTTFTPNEVVTRAQFGTVLSRLLRGTKNNGGKIYYQKHLQALKDADVMTKIDTPSAKELRGWTMLMMQRITNKVSPAENGEKTLWELIQEFFAK